MADTTTEKYCANCACILLQPAEDSGGTRTARVEELLRQNHPPLDLELTAFRKIAEDTRTALEDLDTKIFQAQQLLENLLSARQRVQSHFEDTKFLLHPMHPDVVDPQGAPWLLTRVCHRWRELAINSPQLYISCSISTSMWASLRAGNVHTKWGSFSSGLEASP
ncbi:hypothetical protein BDZ89DRAFT_1083125 [Hymenopellis radicata]|nr:hypothetical protein BDZ89DRAFT_1083125 [Hymenopellis radicata]